MFFSRKIIVIALFLSAMTVPSLALASADTKLSDPFGQSRLLVMCLPNDREISRDETSFIYKTDWEEFSERDLLFIGLNKKTAFNFVAQDLQNSTDAKGVRSQYIYRNPIAGEAIRKRVDCKHDFEMILIGKDTGVKARWTTGFTQEELFSRIDAMPMRRFEMRGQKKKYK
jgi:hypothetical protein